MTYFLDINYISTFASNLGKLLLNLPGIMSLQEEDNRVKNIRGSCEIPGGLESRHLILCEYIIKQAEDIWGQRPGDAIDEERYGGARWRIISGCPEESTGS